MLTEKEIKSMVTKALEERRPKSVLMVVPDYTRCFSNAGLIANIAYHWCVENGVGVELLEALGTHVPMTEAEIKAMYGDIPVEKFHGHDWRHDVEKIGEVPADFVSDVTEGLWKKAVSGRRQSLSRSTEWYLILHSIWCSRSVRLSRTR